jgi:hypothetical protein
MTSTPRFRLQGGSAQSTRPASHPVLVCVRDQKVRTGEGDPQARARPGQWQSESHCKAA